ncbi:MAG: hypothetical protein HZA09_07855, partial [Nitrospirae bacterium]|nr:hypothetical protein [Nitrospirota bacterium]
EAAGAFSRIGKEASQDVMDESLYLRANSLMKIGDYSEAMRLVNLIPAKSRFYIYGLYTKAMISLNTEKENDAIEYLEQVSRNFSGSQAIKDKEKSLLENLALKAHLTLGFTYLEGNNPLEAIKHFSIIPKDSPFYIQALFGSGWAYANMGRWVRVVVFWEELYYLYPQSKYTIEIMPYIGYAYTTLSAYGKALEQNGIALQYYEDLLKKISEIEKEIEGKDMQGIAQAIDMTGDKELSNELDLYNGLSSMEAYLGGARKGVNYEVESLIKTSKKAREEILTNISERLDRRLENLRYQVSEVAANTSLEIARNLRLEGGGQISSEMIFDGP